jgi:hypothetical protein
MKMARWLSATAGTAIVAATFALPASAAFAASGSGNGNIYGVGNASVGSGNTINAPISAPINLCSISVGLLGFANSGCQGGADSTVSTDPGSGGSNGNVTGVGNASVASGNTVNVPVSVPVNVCGVSAGVAGFANSGCKGGAHSHTTIGSGGAGGAGAGSGNITGVGNASVGSGNTINAPISAPVDLCSVSLGLLGFANSSCLGGATTDVKISPSGSNGNTTGVGNLSALAGNTINAPVSLPVNVCAVSVAAGGFANSSCKGGAAVNPQPPTCTDRHCAPKPPACRDTHCAPKPPCKPKPPACKCAPHHGTPPGTTPPGTTPGGTTPGGITPGSTTTVTSATGPSQGLLPTTGADLLGMAAGTAALIGLGTGTVVLSRRRRHGA